MQFAAAQAVLWFFVLRYCGLYCEKCKVMSAFLLAVSSWRSRVGRGSWLSHCQHCLLMLAFAAVVTGKPVAASPPAITDLKDSHAQLRADSVAAQGRVRIYRSDTVIPEALREHPAELGMPLTDDGYIWRSNEKIRVNYKHYVRIGGEIRESVHSLAREGKNVFTFSSADTDIGSLRVAELGTPEATAALGTLDSKFVYPLDSLWSNGGVAIADMLQRPGSEIISNDSPENAAALSVRVPLDDGSATEYHLEPTGDYPFLRVQSGSSESGVKLDRQVQHVTAGGVTLPSRIVDLVSFGNEKGYTQVVILDLEPLASGSPVAMEIGAGSFQDMGSGYQVYYFSKSEEQQLGERYEEESVGSLDSSPGYLRKIFLLANGLLMLGLLGFVIYRRRKRL